MKYDILLWDVDGTLMDFKKSEAAALGQTLKDFGYEPSEELIEDYSRINVSYWKRLELGEITKQQVLVGRFEEFLDKYHMKADPRSFMNAYENHLGHISFVQDDSLELCRSLKEKGFKQYIVTNGTIDVQKTKLRETGFDQIIDVAFISDEIGVPKPMIGFFEVCFEQIFGTAHPDANQRARVLIIGDSISSDIKGGINAGIDCCWYRNPGEENPEGIPVTYEITHLSQILDILQNK